jgi:hypothetical protein
VKSRRLQWYPCASHEPAVFPDKNMDWIGNGVLVANLDMRPLAAVHSAVG